MNIGDHGMSNWHKTSQQETFGFFDRLPVEKQKITTEEYQRLKDRVPTILEQLVNQSSNFKELLSALKMYNFEWTEQNNSILVDIEGQRYVIEHQENPSVRKI